MARLLSFLELSPTQMEASLNKMIKDYPGINLDREKYVVAGEYADKDDPSKAHAIVNTMEDPLMKLVSLKDIIEMIAATNNTAALDIAAKELKKAESFRGQSVPGGLFKINPANAYYEYINVYGKLLFKAGKDERHINTRPRPSTIWRRRMNS